ncbi:hypothetical protein PG996_002866 [Apiospora saccharicola]|uniref:Uncharacterized protein n=1 Tax=Apiospora saccharicola TaxID=335842 RepID=A0ABR1WKK1_9PEZI
MMQPLDLLLDIFKLLISATVQELGLPKSLGIRLTCRVFASEIHDAIITTKVIEDIVQDREAMIVAHRWVTTIRETCELFCQHVGLRALLKRTSVFKILSGLSRDKRPDPELDGGIWLNCCTIAACTDNLPLLKSFSAGSDPDPPTFFGRPSWAAAAHGQVEVMRFLPEQGADTPDPKPNRTIVDILKEAMRKEARMKEETEASQQTHNAYGGVEDEAG